MTKTDGLLKNCYRKEDVNTKIVFYQTPKFLIHADTYKELGLAEKLIYSILRDRLEISLNNKTGDFVDEEGYVFLRFDQEKLGGLLNINKKTVGRYMKKLEEHDSIVIVREGQGKSNRIYITDISKQLEDVYTYENQSKDTKHEDVENTLKGQIVTSRKDKISHLERTKSPHNDTDINKTDFSKTIFLSQEIKKEESEKESKKQNEFQLILDNCNYDEFEPHYINPIIQAIRLLYYSSKPLKINNMAVPPSQVRMDLKLLKWDHIDLALRDFRIQSNIQEIKYPVGYLSRCIYNAIFQGELRIESDLIYNDLI